jgi:O-Antigen ligase
MVEQPSRQPRPRLRDQGRLRVRPRVSLLLGGSSGEPIGGRRVLIGRRPELLLPAGVLLGAALLSPGVLHPTLGIALVGLVMVVALAWKSVAYPLGLAGLPTLIAATVGSNALPKGGSTFVVAGWIGLAVLFAVIRAEHAVPLRGLWSAPAAMALLIGVLMVVRLGSSPAEAYGSTKVQLYIASNLVLFVGAVFVGTSRPSLRLFFLLALAVVAAGAFLLIAKLLSGTAQQQYAGRFEISAQQGAINLGRISSNGALISICLILMSRRLAVRLAAIAVLPAVLVSLLAAGSRGPVVGFVIGVLALVALTATTRGARRGLVVVAVVLVGAAVVVPMVVPGSAIGRSLSAIIGSSGGLSSNGRSQLWGEALAAFARHPLIGLGTGGFASLDPQLFPHDLLLEMAAELGVIGLVAIVSMLGLMLERLMAVWRRTSGTERMEVTLVIVLFLSALTNALISGAITDNTDVWLWGGLGVGIHARHATVMAARRARAAPRKSVPGRPLVIAER